MRVAPTVIDFTSARLGDTVTNTTISTLTYVSSQTNNNNVYLLATVASGLTQYRPYFLNTSTGTLGFGAEL